MMFEFSAIQICDGEEVEGCEPAADGQHLRRKLLESGLFVTSFSEVPQSTFSNRLIIAAVAVALIALALARVIS